MNVKLTQEEYDLIHTEHVSPEDKNRALGYPPYSLSELRHVPVGADVALTIERNYRKPQELIGSPFITWGELKSVNMSDEVSDEDIYRAINAQRSKNAAETGQRLPEPERMTLNTLMSVQFPDLRWVVPNLIPEGLTILAGARKLGKSWMVGQLASSVISGSEFLGEIPETGDVLYLALEDTMRRLSTRIPAPATKVEGDRLELWRVAPKLNDGLLNELESWRSTRENPRLVIVDTLGLVQPARGATNSSDGGYSLAYEDIRTLKAWADEKGCAVIVIMHTRKPQAEGFVSGDPIDQILGSTGYASAADSILVLQRPKTGTAKLSGIGRDVEEFEHLIYFHPEAKKWALAQHTPTYKEIAAQYDLSEDMARKYRQELGKRIKKDPVKTPQMHLAEIMSDSQGK